MTQEVIEALILKRHGWAVAEQFVSSFEAFKQGEQITGNINALHMIYDTLEDLIAWNVPFIHDDRYHDYMDELYSRII